MGRIYALILFILLLSGCVSPAVKLYTETTMGHGCVVGPGLIATVRHVVGDETTWSPMGGRERIGTEVIKRYPGRDGIVILKAKISWLLPPANFRSYTIRPGDSGSPVFDNQGRIIGLVSGKYRDGRVVIVPLPEDLEELE